MNGLKAVFRDVLLRMKIEVGSLTAYLIHFRVMNLISL